MDTHTSTSTRHDSRKVDGLARALTTLHAQVHARMSEEDLIHIRRVAAYSEAIHARSKELIQRGGSERALERGIALHMLHVLLEFSELGHSVLHGSFDRLPDVGRFHSDRFVWNLPIDVRAWKVMHHQGHHPFVNILGKDHDVGYSWMRFDAGQPWYVHHLLQPLLTPILFALPLNLLFATYPLVTAALTEGRTLDSSDAKRVVALLREQALRSYVREPWQARSRFLHTIVGNALGISLAQAWLILILSIEHHAPNVRLFADPGLEETPDAYYRRQILSTTNFKPIAQVDRYFEQVLTEEVRFDDPPEFEVFYGGLDTHVEHHLFPDLPCHRQREIRPRVREICAAHGLPYNELPLDEVLPATWKQVLPLAFPTGEVAAERGRFLRASPRDLLRRIVHGIRYEPRTTGANREEPASRRRDETSRTAQRMPTYENEETEENLYRIRFRKSDVEVRVGPRTTLLQAARRAGVRVPTGCQRGLCRSCTTPKLAGETQLEQRAGSTLTHVTVCTSLPRSDIELDL